MNKILIKNRNNIYEFGVDKIKFIISKNYMKHHDLIATFNFIYNKANISEFSTINNYNYLIKYDDELLNLRSSELFVVNNYYDLNYDLKMGSKSLALNYFYSIFGNYHENETLTTINILISDLSDELNELAQLSDELSLDLIIEELELKSIGKLIDAKLLKDENYANQYDLDYLDLIKIQLKMIIKIAEFNYLKKYFVLLDLKEYNDEIIKILNDISLDNIHIFIFCDSFVKGMNIKDIYINGNIKIDLSNDVDIFNELVLVYPFSTTINEIEIILKDLVNGNITEEVNELIKILY